MPIPTPKHETKKNSEFHNKNYSNRNFRTLIPNFCYQLVLPGSQSQTPFHTLTRNWGLRNPNREVNLYFACLSHSFQLSISGSFIVLQLFVSDAWIRLIGLYLNVLVYQYIVTCLGLPFWNQSTGFESAQNCFGTVS